MEGIPVRQAQPFKFARPSPLVFSSVGSNRKSVDVGYDGHPAAHVVGGIHSKAMPVILHDDDYERWLTGALAYRAYRRCPGAGCTVPIAAYGVTRMNGAGRGCEVEALPGLERGSAAPCSADCKKN